MIRTSLFLPAELHQQLVIAARQERVSLSELVRRFVDVSLAARKKPEVKRMYKVLKEIDGSGERGVTDASTTIDAVLYGEQGVWRGNAKQV